MVKGVAVQNVSTQPFQCTQGTGLAGTGTSGQAEDEAISRVFHPEARRLFQPVADGQSQTTLIRAQFINQKNISIDEHTQRIK